MPTLQPLTSDMLPLAASLFTRYPYKEAQRVVQRLERERLNAFYAAGLRRAVEGGAAHWLATDDHGTPLAMAGLGGESWHSEIYGMKMGKLQPWLNTVQPEAGAALLHTAEDAARAQGLQHLAVRLDGQDFANLQLFERAGWYLVDVSLKFSRPLVLPASEAVGQGSGAGEYVVEVAAPEDAGWIRAIGSQSHVGTHYLNDPALPAEKTRALFGRWLERCIEKLAWRIYVIRRAGQRAGEGLGFVTYLRNRGFAEAVGRTPLILDFILIDPAQRGGGLAPRLIAASLADAARATGPGEDFDYCELRTSAHNLPAVLMYEKCGYRCCATDMVMHRVMQNAECKMQN